MTKTRLPKHRPISRREEELLHDCHVYSISADSLLITTNQSSCLPLASRAALEVVALQLAEVGLLALVFVEAVAELLWSWEAKQQVVRASEEHLRPLRS